MLEYKRLFLISFFEKFSFNGLKSILVIYAINHLSINTHTALEYIGAALGVGFLASISGGLLVDWVRNAKMVIVLGLLCMMTASVLFFVCHQTQTNFFTGCLSLLVLGAGFIRSNVPTLLSNYQKANVDKDIFTEYYINLNIGSFFGVICCGILSELYGWQFGFVIAALANIVAVIFACKLDIKNQLQDELNRIILFKLILVLILGIIATYILINNNFYAAINTFISLSALIYLQYITFFTKELSQKNLYKVIILAFAHLLFLALYEQGSFSLTLFIEKYVDRNITKFFEPINFFEWDIIPVSAFQIIDPLFNVMLGGLVIILWKKLNSKGKMIEPYSKFILGNFVMAVAFYFIYSSIYETKILTPFHIIILYLIFVFAELCIIPTGLRFVSSIAPIRIKSLFMSFWHLGMGFSQWLAFYLAKIATTPKSDQTCINILDYKQSFLMFSYMALGVMAVLIIVKMAEHVYVKRVV